MASWLIKSDPDSYSAADLERDRRTTWDGVTNAAALKHIRAMAQGDTLLVYHTGDQRSVVATARAVSAPREVQGPHGRSAAVVDIEFERWLPAPVPLSAIKARPEFAQFALVRIGRLSVMPVTADEWRLLTAMARSAAPQ